jgi:AcrR family transcriptional regulator
MGGYPKRSYHHGDLKNALLEASLKLIGEVGPEAFTLREVARALGVNHTAVYRHFEDKRALLAAIAEQGFDRMTSAMTSALEGVEGRRARLLALAQAYAGFALESPPHYRVMFGPRVNDDGKYPSLEAAIDRAVKVVRAEVDTRDDAMSVWIATHGYVTLMLEKRVRARSPKAYLATLMEPLLEGLTKRPSASM